ncbi:MAG TPA: uracil-DNA glycosylase [Anaerolineae bacterium]|nr:uracil-DNA glycosylase [Anaerolineae bacterium]
MKEKTARNWKTLTSEVVACRRCPRLVAWREKVAREKRRAYLEWDYWGKPVPGFGDREARLVVLGLAPAAHGANRTGRMFTGDSSGRTLLPAMYRAGFASQPTSAHRDDGLELHGAYLTAVARCAPPGNRPKAEELSNCRLFLEQELRLLDQIRVVLALGWVAFDGYQRMLREYGMIHSRLIFEHGASFGFDSPLPTLIACYHPSRQNTQTGRLTDEMLDQVFDKVRNLLDR